MTRAERARKRAKANLYYARCTAYTFAVFFGTFLMHIVGDSVRGGCEIGGELLIPFAGIMMFYVNKYCREVNRG